MKKTIYILKERDFNQPSLAGFLAGDRAAVRTIDKTTSKRKAEAWKQKSPFNFYEVV